MKFENTFLDALTEKAKESPRLLRVGHRGVQEREVCSFGYEFFCKCVNR